MNQDSANMNYPSNFGYDMGGFDNQLSDFSSFDESTMATEDPFSLGYEGQDYMGADENIENYSMNFDMSSQSEKVMEEFLSTVDNAETAKTLLSEYQHNPDSYGMNTPNESFHMSQYNNSFETQVPSHISQIKPDPLAQNHYFDEASSSSSHKRTREADETSSTSSSFETKTKRKYAPRKNKVKLSEEEEQSVKAYKNREAARKFRKKQQSELQVLLDKEQELLRLNQLYAQKEKEILVQNEIKRKEAEQLYNNVQHLLAFTFSQMSTNLIEQVRVKAKTLGIQENM